MTQQEINKKFEQYAELGKALDLLKKLSAQEVSVFMDDVHTIYAEKYREEAKTHKLPF